MKKNTVNVMQVGKVVEIAVIASIAEIDLVIYGILKYKIIETHLEFIQLILTMSQLDKVSIPLKALILI